MNGPGPKASGSTTVGILGGGQLARMLALAGAPLGLRFLVQDNAAEACAAQVAPLLQADYRDLDALGRFAGAVDLATFDFENVPADSAEWLAARVPVFPNPRALSVAQDRLAEKSLFRSLGIDTPEFATVDSREALDRALQQVGTPSILKTRRLGYDGKGQFRLRDAGDADAAWGALAGEAGGSLILEAFVPFQRELSVLAVRSRNGEFRSWPLTRNWHVDGILALSVAPARADADLQRRAFAHATALAEALDYVGVFALELFEVDGRLLANEMAPRVHNSGHWTIEGAECSQFENHLRAVAGLPLGSTAARGCSTMFNFVGALPPAPDWLSQPGCHWHDYGKSSRLGRKVGHATVCATDPVALAARLQEIGSTTGKAALVAEALIELGLDQVPRAG
jgi:5-(carboxyamino)imidazole ribonucleotide synthase